MTPGMRKLIVCVVTNGRADVSLTTAISMLKMQSTMVSTPDPPFRAEISFVNTLDDALNVGWKTDDADAVFAVEHTIGFDPDFVVEALACEFPVVAGAYPLPVVDWERVKTQPANEMPPFWGNVYSVKPKDSLCKGYAQCDKAELGMVMIKRAALQAIADAHPDIIDSEGNASFAAAGVYGGTRMSASERFHHLHGEPVWTDIRRGGTSTGPTEFGGCVGARTVLR